MPNEFRFDFDGVDVIPSRSTDPDTSHKAEEDVKIRAGSQQAKLLAAFYQLPDGTDDEAKDLAGLNPRSNYWKRCSELRQAGFIEWTGGTRVGDLGSNRGVSIITDKGREWIEAKA